MDTLKRIAKKKIELIVDQFKDKDVNFESNLTTDLRNFAEKQYFLPFLEHFVNETTSLKKAINSKYILQLLLKGESKLFNRDFLGVCGNSYSYNEDDIIILNEKKDFFIVKGVIIKLIENLNLGNPLKYIKEKILLKYPQGSPDGETIYVFDIINKTIVLNLIDEDIKNKKTKKVILDV